MKPVTGNAGEEAQFNRRWRPALMSFFMRRVRQHAEAEDLTQDVFTRLFAASDSIARSQDAYIFQIAANLLTDRFRRARVRQDYRDSMSEISGLGTDLLDPYRVVAARSALVSFGSILDKLPKRTRDIFILYRVENIGLDAIAESFEISRSAVKKHVTKATVFLLACERSDG